MASCPKCGKHPIQKRKDGRRKCSHCGFLPNGAGYDRSGNLPMPIRPTFPVNADTTIKRADWIVSFVRKNGVAEAIQCAGVIGETPESMRAFICRNIESTVNPRFPGGQARRVA